MPCRTRSAPCKSQKGLLDRDLPLCYLALVGLSSLQAFVTGLLLHSGQDEKYESLLLALADFGCDVNIYKAPIKDPMYVKVITYVSRNVLIAAVCSALFWCSWLSSL